MPLTWKSAHAIWQKREANKCCQITKHSDFKRITSKWVFYSRQNIRIICNICPTGGCPSFTTAINFRHYEIECRCFPVWKFQRTVTVESSTLRQPRGCVLLPNFRLQVGLPQKKTRNFASSRDQTMNSDDFESDECVNTKGCELDWLPNATRKWVSAYYPSGVGALTHSSGVRGQRVWCIYKAEWFNTSSSIN